MLLQSVLNVEKQISQSVTFIHALSVCKNNSTKASTKNSYTVVAQYQFFTFHCNPQHVVIMIDITYQVAYVHCVWLKKETDLLNLQNHFDMKV